MWHSEQFAPDITMSEMLQYTLKDKEHSFLPEIMAILTGEHI